MAEKQLSQVTIKHTSGDTTAHFAADIDDFMVYTDDKGTAHSVKKLVFGDTPPTDFVTKGNMWAQLKTQADRCQQTLDMNASFWNGLSNENYQDPSEDGDAGSSYLATGDDINNLHFYGSDYFDSASKDKLVSLGALEDFAKRIPTMGNTPTIVLGCNPEDLTSATRFAIGIGDANQKKTGLRLEQTPNEGYSSMRPTLYTDGYVAHGETVATCAWANGSQERSSAPIVINQPLELWTKAIIVLNGFNQDGNKCASQMVTIMPDNPWNVSQVYWHCHETNLSASSSTIYIDISKVEYKNSQLILTLSVSTGNGYMTNIAYACEFAGIAM